MRPTRLALIASTLLVVACSRPAEPVATPEAATTAAQPALGAAPPASKPSLAGTPFASFDTPSPALAAKKNDGKAQLKYKNGKLVEDHSPPVLQIMSEFGDDSGGVLKVQAFPGDVVYMGVTVQTEAGSALKNQIVEITPSQPRTRVVLMNDHTDREGYLEFHLLAGALGKDSITVTSAGISRKFVLEVKKPERSEWLGALDLKGVTSWDLLMATDVKLERERTEAQFSPELKALAAKPVRIVGFMLPLESTEKQKHFLLSANPPACFFHPPGGPSSVVEVFADGGVTANFDPMVVEGRLELVETSDAGVIYKLHGAKLVAR